LSDVCLQDVDDFLQKKAEDGFSPHTLVVYSLALRMFFQYGEIRGLTSSRIAGAIQNPRIARPEAAFCADGEHSQEETLAAFFRLGLRQVVLKLGADGEVRWCEEHVSVVFPQTVNKVGVYKQV
jgi:sugar/nucleoside kinase (ribokinase family)